MAVPTSFWCSSVAGRWPGLKIPYNRDPDRDGERESHLLRGMACVSKLHCLRRGLLWGNSVCCHWLSWPAVTYKTVLRGKSSGQLLLLCSTVQRSLHVILKKLRNGGSGVSALDIAIPHFSRRACFRLRSQQLHHTFRSASASSCCNLCQEFTIRILDPSRPFQTCECPGCGWSIKWCQ